MLKDLINIANKLDAIGLTKEADKIDFLIKKVSQESEPLPWPKANQDYLDKAKERNEILKSKEKNLSNDSIDTVKKIQRLLDLPPDGIWGGQTDEEFTKLIINFANQFPQKVNERDTYIEKLFKPNHFDSKKLKFTRPDPEFVGSLDDALRFVSAMKDIMRGSIDDVEKIDRRVLPINPTPNKPNSYQEPRARTQTKSDPTSDPSYFLPVIGEHLVKREFIGKDQFNRVTNNGRLFRDIMGYNPDYWMQIHDKQNFDLLARKPEKVNYNKALKAYYDKATNNK